MKQYVVIIYNVDGTHSIHHVSLLRSAKKIQNHWTKQHGTIVATIFSNLIEKDGKWQ